jgi:hypothetical protein
MPAAEMRKLMRTVALVGPVTTFRASPDKKAVLKVELTDPMKQQLTAILDGPRPTNTPPAQVEGQAAAAAQSTVYQSPDLMRRYGVGGRGQGRGGGGGGVAPAPVVVRPAAKPAGPPKDTRPFIYALQGSWDTSGDRYALEMQDEKNAAVKLEATAEDDLLILTTGGVTYVFNRQA